MNWLKTTNSFDYQNIFHIFATNTINKKNMEPKIKYGDIVRLKSDKNIIGKITIDNNPNGILEYKIKDNNERHYGHYSEFELVTDPNIISEFDDIESRSFL